MSDVSIIYVYKTDKKEHGDFNNATGVILSKQIKQLNTSNAIGTVVHLEI